MKFQSPQWGSNSKESKHASRGSALTEFQSPQWGSNSKELPVVVKEKPEEFQSPQWGSNSKEKPVP